LFLVPVDTDIKGEYDILVNELTKYNPEMLDKERLLVISKCDMLDDELTAELKKN
jgi:GTP-binding protein